MPATLVSASLQVTGTPATWHFEGRVFVDDPDIGAVRKAYFGECTVNLIQNVAWGTDVPLETKDTDADGDAMFDFEAYPPGAYSMEAVHKVSGDRHGIRMVTKADGTYEYVGEYH